MITQSIKLNLIPGDVPQRIKASQYDEGSRSLVFTLYNGTTAFTTTGITAQIRGTKPDMKGFAYDAEYSAGVVTASLTQQMSCVAGDVNCEIVLSKTGEVLGTANFILEVEKAALGEDTDISETEIPVIIDAARSSAAAAAASATSAGNSATAAAGSATAAAGSATQAAGSATTAGTSANNAAASATAASTSAGQAATSATSAGTHEANALTYRNQAKEYRDEAAGYAGEASYSFMVDDAGYICLNRKEDES